MRLPNLSRYLKDAAVVKVAGTYIERLEAPVRIVLSLISCQAANALLQGVSSSLVKTCPLGREV